MIDYDKAIANINKPILEINKYIEYHENEIKKLIEKRDYIRNKKNISKSIINKIISGEIQPPSKKQKLITKHPENINNRIRDLNKQILVLEETIKVFSKFEYKYHITEREYELLKVCNDENFTRLNVENMLYRYKTKLNRYLQVRNKLDKGE